MDGRFSVVRAIPESVALDRANDVLALSQEGREHLAHAYEAHIVSDWASYLYETDRLNQALVAIRDVARLWADEVRTAPEAQPDQLPLRLVGEAAV